MSDVIKNTQDSESFIWEEDENSAKDMKPHSMSNSMFNTDNEDELEEDDLDINSHSGLGLDLLLNEDYLKSRNKREQGMGMPFKKESDDDEDRYSAASKRSGSRGSGSRKSSQQKQSRYSTRRLSSSAGSDIDIHDLDGSLPLGGAPKGSGRIPPSFGARKKSNMPRETLWENDSEDRDSFVSEISYVSRKGKEDRSPYEKRKMTADDILNKKQELLFEIDRFEQKGKKYFRKLTISSSLEEIKNAYQKLELDCELDESIQSSRRFIIFVVNIVETICTNSLVKRYLPFELRLSGWSQSVYLEMEKGSYDNVFKKLYIKYRNYTLVSPEVELAGLLFMSGMSFHIGNMFLNNFPILNDAVKANPSFMPQMMSSFSQPMGAPAAAPSQPVGGPSTNAAGVNSGGGGGGPGMSNLFGMIGTALNMFTGSSGSPVKDTTANPSMQRGDVAPPPMPMPRGCPPAGSAEQATQMKGPGNVDAILQELQSLDNAHDGKLDAISDLESEFSDLPDDMSLSGVFSTKKNNQVAPAAAPVSSSGGAKRGRPAKSQSAAKKTVNV